MESGVLIGCAEVAVVTLYLAAVGCTWPGYDRLVLVACLCRARKD